MRKRRRDSIKSIWTMQSTSLVSHLQELECRSSDHVTTCSQATSTEPNWTIDCGSYTACRRLNQKSYLSSRSDLWFHTLQHLGAILNFVTFTMILLPYFLYSLPMIFQPSIGYIPLVVGEPIPGNI